MAEFAEKMIRRVPAEEAAAAQAERAMLWKRILVWSSILMMLAATVLVIRAL